MVRRTRKRQAKKAQQKSAQLIISVFAFVACDDKGKFGANFAAKQQLKQKKQISLFLCFACSYFFHYLRACSFGSRECSFCAPSLFRSALRQLFSLMRRRKVFARRAEANSTARLPAYTATVRMQMPLQTANKQATSKQRARNETRASFLRRLLRNRRRAKFALILRRLFLRAFFACVRRNPRLFECAIGARKLRTANRKVRYFRTRKVRAIESSQAESETPSQLSFVARQTKAQSAAASVCVVCRLFALLLQN